MSVTGSFLTTTLKTPLFAAAGNFVRVKIQDECVANHKVARSMWVREVRYQETIVDGNRSAIVISLVE